MMSELSAIRKQSGFTLVELMVTLVVAFLVIAAVYASFKVQQQNEKAQQQVTQIQQNLRAAMDMMSREFPMAGYDPLQSGEYEIITASQNTFSFSADINEDGDKPDLSLCDERYDFEFNPLADPTIVVACGGDPIAENIDQIEFRYLLADGTYTLNPPLNDIVAVRVSILARADEPDFKYTDNNTYSTGFTDMDGNDIVGTTWDPSTFAYPNNLNYRRRMLAKTIYLRNMGLF